MEAPQYASFDPIQNIAMSASQAVIALAHRTHVSVIKINANNIDDHCTVQPTFKGTFTLTDIAWCPVEEGKLAISGTSGTIAILDVSASTGKKPKQEWDSGEATRAISKICWHKKDKFIICGASQDGQTRLYDIRQKKNNACISIFSNKSDSVAIRDIQFDPFHEHLLASVSDNGNLLVWDIRNTESPFSRIACHSSPSQTLAWDTSCEYRVATGGRDKTAKIWDLNNIEDYAAYIRPTHTIHTASSVNKVKWRPNSIDQLAISLVEKGEIVIFDINMPHLAACVLKGHTDACADFEWIDTPQQDTGIMTTNIDDLQSKPSNLKRSSTNTWLDLKPNLLSLYQHILSVDKEGKLLIQDVRNGFFPRQHISGTSAGFASDDRLVIHQGVIDRSNILNLVANEATVHAGKLFSDSRSKFGIDISIMSKVITRPILNSPREPPMSPSTTDSKRLSSRAKSPEKANIASRRYPISPTPSQEDLLRKITMSAATDRNVNDQNCLLLVTAQTKESYDDEYIVEYLAKNYMYGDKSILSTLCCAHNRDVATQLGLLQRAAMWSTMEILIPQLSSQLSRTLLSSLLVELLDNCDCQSFVICIEVLKQQQSLDSISIPRLQEGYVAYIDLLNKFGLYTLSTALLRTSDDAYLQRLSQSGVVIYSSCSTCGKELQEGLPLPWCTKCKMCVSICSFCDKPVKGLLHWCPVCAHGGHIACMKEWFTYQNTCPAGCGHDCCRKSDHSLLAKCSPKKKSGLVRRLR